MNTPIIPTWAKAVEAVDKGNATPLETFVYNNEPAGNEESAKFRDELQKLVNHVFTLGELSEFDRMD